MTLEYNLLPSVTPCFIPLQWRLSLTFTKQGSECKRENYPEQTCGVKGEKKIYIYDIHNELKWTHTHFYTSFFFLPASGYTRDKEIQVSVRRFCCSVLIIFGSKRTNFQVSHSPASSPLLHVILLSHATHCYVSCLSYLGFFYHLCACYIPLYFPLSLTLSLSLSLFSRSPLAIHCSSSTIMTFTASDGAGISRHQRHH